MSRRSFATTTIAAALLMLPSIAHGSVSDRGHNVKAPDRDKSIKVYGNVRIDGTFSPNRDLYFKDPLSFKEGASKNAPKNTTRMNIEKSRLGIIANNDGVTTTLEVEADGSYDQSKVAFKLRQATIGFGNLVLGRACSTFIDPNASPETLSPSSPIGQPNYSVSNINLIRYASHINERSNFALSLEEGISKPNTDDFDKSNYIRNSKCPTMVGSFDYKTSWGHVGVRALEQHWGTYDIKGGLATKDKWAGAAQLSGSVNIGKDKLLGTIYTGKGLGVYGTENDSRIVIEEGVKQHIALNKQTGWQVGYTHNWNSKIRSNAVVSCANTIMRDCKSYIKNAQDYSVNTMVKIAKNIEFGTEYLHQKTKSADDATSNSGSKKMNANRIAAALISKF